ncbi:MAG: type VI secretion system baseplate subunit TssE [Deltaproteobacteria bacterium]|nr:type VI secretion system baseplate subunit TssE [Deltaproteobacteria bacterium]MBW1863675.1 type VI secretion system baseplate subunit TssE [Deltaproteobacteria bacterium]
MDKSRTAYEARASLIDRLVDIHPESPTEDRPLRSLSREELKESLRRDLESLLNTRTSLPGSLFDKWDLTVIDYGIPDFGSDSHANPNYQILLIKRITRSILAFEPRLQNVRVTVDPNSVDERGLHVIIDAIMVVESVREPVSFRTTFHSLTGSVEVYEGQK